MLVIGDKEIEGGKVAVRARKEGDLGAMNINDFLELITKEIQTRSK